MKNRCFVLLAAIVVVTALSLIQGCRDGTSSAQEAIYATQQQDDFGEILFHKKFYTAGVGIGLNTLRVADDAGNKEVANGVAHIVIYKTKNGEVKCVVLDGNRPPREVKSPK